MSGFISSIIVKINNELQEQLLIVTMIQITHVQQETISSKYLLWFVWNTILERNTPDFFTYFSFIFQRNRLESHWVVPKTSGERVLKSKKIDQV
jgi:hypothetical protein